MRTFKDIGARIKKRRKEIELTQTELARKLNMSDDSRTTITKWENGYAFPDVEKIDLLCSALDCDVGYLFSEYDEPLREVHDISEITGLSKKAINNLQFFSAMGMDDAITFLSRLFEHPEFLAAIDCIDKYAELRKKCIERDHAIQAARDLQCSAPTYFTDDFCKDFTCILEEKIRENSKLYSYDISVNDAERVYKISAQDYLQDAIRDALKGLIQNGSDTRTKE